MVSETRNSISFQVERQSAHVPSLHTTSSVFSIFSAVSLYKRNCRTVHVPTHFQKSDKMYKHKIFILKITPRSSWQMLMQGTLKIFTNRFIHMNSWYHSAVIKSFSPDVYGFFHIFYLICLFKHIRTIWITSSIFWSS